MRVNIDKLAEDIKKAIRKAGVDTDFVVTLLHDGDCAHIGGAGLAACTCGEVEFLVEACDVEYSAPGMLH